MNQTDSIEQTHHGTWRALRVGFDAAIELLPGALQAASGCTADSSVIDEVMTSWCR